MLMRNQESTKCRGVVPLFADVLPGAVGLGYTLRGLIRGGVGGWQATGIYARLRCITRWIVVLACALFFAQFAAATVLYEDYRGVYRSPSLTTLPLAPGYYVNGPEPAAPNQLRPIDDLSVLAANPAVNAINGPNGTVVAGGQINYAQASNTLCNNDLLQAGNPTSTECATDHKMGRVIYARIRFLTAGTYALRVTHDDQVQLDMSSSYGNLDFRNALYDIPVARVASYTNDTSDAATAFSIGHDLGSYTASANSCALIRVYWNNTGGINHLRLWWKRGNQTAALIPGAQLYDPSVAPGAGECTSTIASTTPSISLTKNVASRAPGDQFTVQIASDALGATVLKQGTTSGTGTGDQETVAATVTAGTTYYLRDVVVNNPSGLAAYIPTMAACTGGNTATVVSPGVWSVRPTGTNQVKCTITNAAITYTVQATAGLGGTASCTPNPAYYGSVSTCTAAPAAGYGFSSWTGACAGQGATCTLSNITSNQASQATFVLLPGVLTVTKNVSGTVFAAATSYDFSVACASPIANYSGAVTVGAGASSGQSTVNIPAGSTNCQIAEDIGTRPAAPANYAWGSPVYTQPSAAAVVAGGSLSGAIANPLMANPGALVVTKRLTGAIFASSTSYNFSVACSNPSGSYPGVVTVPANASSGQSTVGIPVGSTSCQITEDIGTRPLPPTNYLWGNPTYIQPSATAMGVGGTASGEISNPLLPTPASLSLGKAGPVAMTSGGSYDYTLTVTNSGQTASAVGVVVQDQLPAGMMATGASGASCTPLSAAGALVSCILPTAVAGNNGTAAITLTVTAPAAGGSITNYASVDPAGGSTPPVPGASCVTANCASATTTVTPKADLSITKTASPSGTYVPGQALNYSIVVSNAGPSAVTGASVTDTVPANVTVSSWSCSPAANCGATTSGSGNNVALTGINLASGESLTISISGTAQLSATGDIVNSATITPPAGVSCTTAPCAKTSTTTNTNSGTPKLSISKTATPAAFAVGQTGTYSIMVSNSGTSSTSAAITVSDSMPVGISIQLPVTASGWDCTASTAAQLSCTSSAVLLPGSNAQVINAQVAIANAVASPVQNTASVSGGGVTCDANCTSTITTNVNAPKLDVRKTLSAPFVVGVANSYVITATNNGQAATLAGTITDDVPVGLVLGSLPAACSASGQTVTCSVPAGLATGGTVSFTIPVTPQASASGSSVENTAIANPDTGDASCPAAAHCAGKTDNTVLAPQLTLAKQASVGTFTVDVPASYTLTLTNTGTAATTAAATVSDTVPAGLVINTASLDAACVPTPAGSQTLVCSVPAGLAVNASKVFSIGVTAQNSVNGQSVTNTATAAGGGDPLCAVGSAVADLPARCKPSTTTAVNAPQLTMTKSASVASFSVGVAASYVLTVRNTGTAATSGSMTVTDVVPSSMTLGAMPAGCTATDQQVSCTTTQSLAIDASIGFTIPVTPTAAASPSVSNTASVMGGGDPTCPTTANCSASTSTPVDAPSLKLVKTDNGPWVIAQSNATYTLTVNNASATVATVGTITVQDSMPAGITPAAGTYGNWTCTVSGQDVSCTSASVIAASNNSAIVLPVSVGAGAITSGTSATVTNHGSAAGGGDPYNGGTPPAPGASCTDANHCASKDTGVNTAATLITAKALASVNGQAVPAGYQAQPGDVLGYQITVSNSGGTAGTTTLTETVPAGTAYTGAAQGWSTTPAACAAAASTCTQDVTAGANASQVVNFTVTVQAPLVQSAISNAVTSSAAGSCAAGCSVSVPAAVVDVQAVITEMPAAPLVIGQPITIVGVCTNNGPVPAVGASCSMVINTVLKASMPATCDASRTLPVGDSLSCSLSFTPAQAMSITATVTAAADSYETNLANNVDTRAVDANTPSTLIVAKTLSEVNGAAVPVGYLVKPGDILGYQLQVTNTGGTAGSMTLTETVPVGSTYVGLGNGDGEGWSTSPACVAAGSNCAQQVSVPAGGVVSVRFSVKVADMLTAADITNTVTSSEAGACGAGCTVATPTRQADVAVVTPPSLSFTLGEEVKVVSSCTNQGPADTINAACVVSGAPDGAVTVCTPTSPVATLAAGASIGCVTSWKPTAAISFVLTTTASHALYDPVMANNVGVTTVVVGNAPLPAAVKPVPMDARWALLVLSVLIMGWGAALRRKH